jgi:predicted protein tyrosine phosphatase
MPYQTVKPNILAFPYPRFVIEDKLVKSDALISINSPIKKSWEMDINYEEYKHVLLLDFDDIPFDTYQKGEETYYGPTKEHVNKAIAFSNKVKEDNIDFIAVHCTAGKSRSAGIALAILASHLGEGNEELAVKSLLLHDKDQQMCFNPKIITLADEILNGKKLLDKELNNHCPAYVSWKKYWEKKN